MRHFASTSCSLVCASSSSSCLSCSFSPSFSSSCGSEDVLSPPGDEVWRDPSVLNRPLQFWQPLTLFCRGGWIETHRVTTTTLIFKAWSSLQRFKIHCLLFVTDLMFAVKTVQRCFSSWSQNESSNLVYYNHKLNFDTNSFNDFQLLYVPYSILITTMWCCTVSHLRRSESPLSRPEAVLC